MAEEFIRIQFSQMQLDLWEWCNKHYHQLKEIKQSGYLDVGGQSFTVHLMPSKYPIIPQVDHLDLHGKYYPQGTGLDIHVG